MKRSIGQHMETPHRNVVFISSQLLFYFLFILFVSIWNPILWRRTKSGTNLTAKFQNKLYYFTQKWPNTPLKIHLSVSTAHIVINIWLS